MNNHLARHGLRLTDRAHDIFRVTILVMLILGGILVLDLLIWALSSILGVADVQG